MIINNAATGLGSGVRGREETSEGLERVMATNHLGPHLLTTRYIEAVVEVIGVVKVVQGDPKNVP